MKPRRLKIFPDVIYSNPSTVYFKPLSGKESSIVLDLSNLRNVNSSGLTILLIHLLKLIQSSNNHAIWSVEIPKNKIIFERLYRLGFFQIIDNYLEDKDLFWPQEKIQDVKEFEEYEGNYLENIISVPIYTLDFLKEENRRNALPRFREWLLRYFENFTDGYESQLNQLILVLNEIVKNSGDHTFENCFIGLDLIKSDDKVKICFSFGDLGKGIMQNVRDYWHENDIARAKYFSIDELYKWALEFGNSTKKSSNVNAGVGMTTIVEGVKPLDLELFVYDAESCGYLNNVDKLSFSKLRKNFYHLGHHVGFYYYGELSVES